MATSPTEVGAIADATTGAASRRLKELRNDSSFAYCFWLLTRIALASREDDFAGSLSEVGLAVRSGETALSFIVYVSRHAGQIVERHPESGPFATMASLSMRRALTETVGQQGTPLFESSLDDLRAAFRRHSTPVQFATVATLYFSDLFARTLRYYVDREVTNVTSAGNALTTVDDAQVFVDALDLYARQTARIMERYAEEWYSKRSWLDEGKISFEQAKRFTAYALKKLEADFTLTESR